MTRMQHNHPVRMKLYVSKIETLPRSNASDDSVVIVVDGALKRSTKARLKRMLGSDSEIQENKKVVG